MRLLPTLAAALLAICTASCSSGAALQRPVASWNDVVALPAPSVGQRIAYGSGAKQFGELRMPTGRGPHPVVVLLHGGCWSAEYDLDYMGHLADRLAAAGIASWNLEYRGIGDIGGAWPGTFDDVATGAAHVHTLARTFPLDLQRVVLVGHSAGGHLATWLAAARHVAPSHAQHALAPLPVRGVVTLAGIVDLRDYASGSGSCNKAVQPLLGGSAQTVPERYAAASPSALLPIGVPMRMLIGAKDPIVTGEHNARFAEQARLQGDDVALEVIEGAGHFDLVMPTGTAAKRVQRAIKDALRSRRKH